jgi:phospholipid/cholesterol/gamma-HCH transport system substrate-binding protein
MRARIALVAMALLAVGGCGFNGVQNLHLPGGVGDGSDGIKLTVDLPDAGGLVANNQVKVGDVAVGTIDSLTTTGWHAVAKISIEPSMKLPANSVARVGTDSLLGSSYLEIDPPAANAQGRLVSGMTIPLSRSRAYPSTEAVLSAASVVLNGGGVEQIGTITRELNAAFNGNGQALQHLLPRVNSFITTLNQQKTQIYAAIDSLDQLSKKFADNRAVFTTALNSITPALATLNRERVHLTQALESVSNLGSIATPLVSNTRDEIVSTLRNAVPILQQINRAGDSLVKGLGFAVTFPFAPETVLHACHGDYCNLNLVLDLTNQALVNGFTTSSGQLMIPGLPGIPSLSQLGNLLGSLGTNPLGGLLNLTGGLLSSKPKSTTSTGSGSSGSTTRQPTKVGSLLGNLLGGLGGGK